MTNPPTDERGVTDAMVHAAWVEFHRSHKGLGRETDLHRVRRCLEAALSHQVDVVKLDRKDIKTVCRAMDGMKDRLFDANALDANAVALFSAGSDALHRIVVAAKVPKP